MLACLPWFAMAQSNDDLYFIPKKEKKTEVKKETRPARQVVISPSVIQKNPSAVVVRDVEGKPRNVDEYNRRYSTSDSNFSTRNDTLYVDEKPYGERGEWVNGFDGTQDDYEYAMRIVRFRNPRYAIPVSSPVYWDVVYGGGLFPSWDWNVYDDGMYAYVFPTFSNPLWWDWRWSWGMGGSYWGFGWRSPWYYSGWYSPWYAGYWGGFYGPSYWGPGYYGYHHHYPYYGGWGGGYWSNHYATNYNNRRGETGYTPGRGQSFNTSGGSYNNRVGYNAFDRNGRTGGRVVHGSNDASVRGYDGGRTNGVYTRPGSFGGENSYTRPSSTRTNSYTRPGSTRNYNSYRESGSYERMQNSNRGNSGTFSRGSSSGSTFGGGSYRSSGGSSTRSSGGGMSTGGGGGARRR